MPDRIVDGTMHNNDESGEDPIPALLDEINGLNYDEEEQTEHIATDEHVDQK